MTIQDDLRAELRRREARQSLQTWCEMALAPMGQVPARHHKLLIQKLQAVAGGEIQRLLITMPPGSAKTTYSSILFPAWFLAQAPFQSVIAASHTAELAEQFSRRLMGLIREHSDILGYQLATEGVASWQTTTGCQYMCAGVGGPITGRRADLAIIDDPVKSRAQADSASERDKSFNWFTSDLRSRLRPGASIVLVMTRWHEDDLGGRLLQSQRDQWDVVNLPAIAGENDPLGREPGEFLWTDGPYGFGNELQRVFNDYTALGAGRDWASLYMQDPRPSGGGLFKTENLKRIDAIPEGITSVLRAWDLAATRSIGNRNADWTAGVKLARTTTGAYIVLHVERLRGDPAQIEAAILRTAEADGRSVRISLPQDPGQAGLSQAQNLVKMLAGFDVSTSRETGDKATRAAPVAAQVNIGNVSLLKGPWVNPFVDELEAFPSGKWDDQCDGLARAFNTLSPQMRGAGVYELAVRDLARLRAEEARRRGPEPPPLSNPFQPGSVEHSAREAELKKLQKEE